MMNTPDLRSPFVERVISLLPRGHEEAMKQAFYNVAAMCLFIMMASAAMAVYFILEPFVKPLLWAVLVGSVLHPLKRKSAIVACNWLTSLKEENTLLVFGFLSVPVQLLNRGTELLGTALFSHLKLFFFLCCGLHLLQIVQQYYCYSDLIGLYETAIHLCQHLSLSGDLLLQPVFGAAVLGLFGIVLSLMSHRRLYVAMLSVWIVAFVILLISLGSWSLILMAPLSVLFCVSLAIDWGWLQDDYSIGEDESFEKEEVVVNVSTPMPPNGLTRFMRSHIVASAISSWSTPSSVDHQKTMVFNPSSSNRYILRALWACLIVQLSRHMWLFHFVPIPFVYFMVKACGSYFNVWRFLDDYKSRIIASVSQNVAERKDHIFPKPIQHIYKAVVFLDRMVIERLIHQLDAVVTVVIIFVVVVLTVLASVFAAVQIYGESVHLLRFGTNLANQTLNNPEARQWLPQGIEQMIDLGSVVDNAYSYGKTGIATLVMNTINEKDPGRAAQIERIISEALNRVQRAWLSQGESNQGVKLPSIEDVINSNSTAAKRPPLLRRLSQDFLNVTVLVNYGKENIGSIFSILDSIWNIMKGNLSLVFKSTTAILSILMGGGTAILNFLVNGVVFLTALYYLLVASDAQYKPIQMVSFLSPGGGNTLGTAMEEAINTVCMASLKLAAFYGLWTWLIHTVFGVNFVVIPVALAALLGAVPFLGTYWAALPAALDLWLAQSRGVEALCLIAFQFAPTMLVDASFYAEIKGGGHPYLTGLAVAGGIFWLGVEGAIIGPLLLCVLLVAVSVYTTLFQTENQTTAVGSNARWFHRRLLRTDTVG